MAEITAGLVKELRDRTGTGMMECKKALEGCGGDIDKAVDNLRQRGLASAQKRAGRVTSEGIIASYIHMERLGVLVEVDCETDFVARTDDFKTLAKDISMHVAAANPQYLSQDDVPQEVIDREKEIFRGQVEGKPENIVDKIIQGKLGKFFEETCLLEQVFIKDPDGRKKVKDLVTDAIAKTGENIVVKRFARFQVGEDQ
jgi:elongation factor Ts